MTQAVCLLELRLIKTLLLSQECQDPWKHHVWGILAPTVHTGKYDYDKCDDRWIKNSMEMNLDRISSSLYKTSIPFAPVLRDQHLHKSTLLIYINNYIIIPLVILNVLALHVCL